LPKHARDEKQKNHSGTLLQLRHGVGGGLVIGILGGEEDRWFEFVGFLKEYEKH
jgi:hypothetical protein